jgi:anti-sigma-K factor RskA
MSEENENPREEQAALYAIDQLFDAEREQFEKELARDPALQDLVRDLRETSAAVAFAVGGGETPSADLRERVLAAAAGKKRRIKPGKVVGFALHARVAWAVAACAVIAAGLFQVRWFSMRSAFSASETTQKAVLAEIRSLEQQMEAERILGSQQLADMRRAADVANLKIARLAALSGNSPTALAIAVWNPLNQEGVLTVESLPLLQRDQDYQLWVIDPQYTDPVNGGVFSVDAQGCATLRFQPEKSVGGVTSFAISLERKGGVPKAEGPMVALGSMR